MTDIQDEIKKMAEKDGFGTNVPIFNDQYNTLMTLDIASTLPEQPETTDEKTEQGTSAHLSASIQMTSDDNQ